MYLYSLLIFLRIGSYFGRDPKLEIHYTPKHGSWLNIAEIELSHLSRQCLNRRIPDQETFIHETNAWCKRRNESNATVDWQFTTDDARIKLKRLYPILMK